MTSNALLWQSMALWLALIFGWAAYSKLSAWHELPGVIINFQILPRALVTPVAFALPMVEAAIAVGLLLPVTRSASAAAAALMLATFGLAMLVNLRRGRVHIDCGCFRSDLKQAISWAMVVRNGVLAAAAWALAAAGSDVPQGALQWVLTACAAATLMSCYLAFGLTFQAPPARYEDNFRAGLDTH